MSTHGTASIALLRTLPRFEARASSIADALRSRSLAGQRLYIVHRTQVEETPVEVALGDHAR